MENCYPANPSPNAWLSLGTRARRTSSPVSAGPASFPYLSGQSGVSQGPSGTEYSCFCPWGWRGSSLSVARPWRRPASCAGPRSSTGSTCTASESQAEGRCQEETVTYPLRSVLYRAMPTLPGQGRPTPTPTVPWRSHIRTGGGVWRGCLLSVAQRLSNTCQKNSKSAWRVSTLFAGQLPAMTKYEASRTLTWC